MRTFKTICHNNIHRDYTDELIKVDSTLTPAILWKDSRPTYTGELKILVMGKSVGDFDVIDLVIGEEYELRIKGHQVYIMLNDIPCVVICGRDKSENVTVLGLGDGLVLDTLDYHEFFYSEEQIRDNKLKKILE